MGFFDKYSADDEDAQVKTAFTGIVLSTANKAIQAAIQRNISPPPPSNNNLVSADAASHRETFFAAGKTPPAALTKNVAVLNEGLKEVNKLGESLRNSKSSAVEQESGARLKS